MKTAKLRFHVFDIEIVDISVYLSREDIPAGSPEKYQTYGRSDELFIYNHEGIPIKSFHEIINDLPVDYINDARAAAANKVVEKKHVLRGVRIMDNKYGLIPAEGIIVTYRVKVNTEEKVVPLERTLGEIAAENFINSIISGEITGLITNRPKAAPENQPAPRE